MRDLTRRQLNAAALGGLAALGGAALVFRHDPASATDKPEKKFEIERTPEEWRKQLTPEQFYVLRGHGTERPFTHVYDKLYDAGVYNCAAATCRCSPRRRSTTAAPAGRASGSRSRTRSARRRIGHSG